MKIACLVPSLQKKGPVIVALNICKALSPYVEKFDIFYFSESQDRIDYNSYPHTAFTKIDFFKAYNFSSYDILHAHSMRPDVYVAYFKNKITAATVTTVHNYVHQELSYTYNNFVSIVFSKIWIKSWKKRDALVFLSNHMKNYYDPKYIHAKRPVVIHNAVYEEHQILSELTTKESKQLSEISSLKERYMLIGGCGVLNKRKGFEEIIDFLYLNRTVAALIIGDGPELENLKKYAQKLGVAERCLFIGFKIDVLRWMRLLDIYVMSSYSEGFPLVMLEAANLKIPILCVHEPLFVELFSSQEVVFYERNNKVSMEMSLDELLNCRNQYASAISQAVSERYNSLQLGSKYLNLYLEIIK